MWDDTKSDGVVVYEMKFKQVVYRSVHQNCIATARRCTSLSVGFDFLLVKFVLRCGVDHVLGGALRLL